MKISKNELNSKWDEYESDRKDKIARILEVSYSKNFIYVTDNSFRREKGLLMKTEMPTAQPLVMPAL